MNIVKCLVSAQDENKLNQIINMHNNILVIIYNMTNISIIVIKNRLILYLVL